MRVALVLFACGLLLILGGPGALARETRAPAGHHVVAEIQGSLDEHWIESPSNPSRWQEWAHAKFDAVENATLVSRGFIPHGKPEITIAGYIQASLAAPNEASSCLGNFSLQPRPPDPFAWSVYQLVADAPIDGRYVQASGPADGYCGGGGVDVSGVPFPGQQNVEFTRAIVPSCVFARPHPCPKPFVVTVNTPTNKSELKVTLTLLGDPASDDEAMFYWLFDRIDADLLNRGDKLRSDGSATITIPPPLDTSDMQGIDLSVDWAGTKEASGSARDPGPIRSIPIALTAAGRALLLRKAVTRSYVLRVKLTATTGHGRITKSQSITVPAGS
jgi:hypothetical protein